MYVQAFEIEKGAIERALYWDTDEPYNYYRLTSDDKLNSSKELLIAGGKDNLVREEKKMMMINFRFIYDLFLRLVMNQNLSNKLMLHQKH